MNCLSSQEPLDIEDTLKMKTGNLLIRNVYRNGNPKVYEEYLIELLDN